MSKRFTVAVLGAAGGIGQPLSLLLSANPDVADLRLYDVVPVVEGVAKDISHINTHCKVTGYAGSIKDKSVSSEALARALKGVEVVVIPAGVPRKPGMTRDDLFGINAGIVAELITGVAKTCPTAAICIISNPVNSNIPIAAEILKKHGVFNPKKLFGVSTLDIIRSNKFISDITGVDATKIEVPVIGGHSGVTILPILSQTQPQVTLKQPEVESLTKKIQTAGTEVVEAKKGAGSATLSMGFAGARFAASVMRGLKGDRDVVECSFVFDERNGDYFAWPLKLGIEGVEKILPFADGELSKFESETLEKVVKPELKKAVEKGVAFVKAKL